MERHEPFSVDYGVLPAVVQQTMHIKDHEPEWVIYAQSNYEFRNSESLAGKFAVTEDQVKRLKAYQKEGVRRTVIGVFLTHRFEFPHVLILQHTDSQKYTLPSGKYKSWEKPREILKQKLGKYIQKIEDASKNKFATRQLSNVPSSVNFFNDVEIGEFIGEWWRTEFYTDPLPYLPPHVTRPKERLRVYQVTLPSRCLFNLPPGFTLKALPLFDLESAQYGQAIGGIPHLLCRFKLHCMVEGEVERSTHADTAAISPLGHPQSLPALLPFGGNGLSSQERTGGTGAMPKTSQISGTQLTGGVNEVVDMSVVDNCVDEWIISNTSEDERNIEENEIDTIPQNSNCDTQDPLTDATQNESICSAVDASAPSQDQTPEVKEALPDELADIILEDR